MHDNLHISTVLKTEKPNRHQDRTIVSKTTYKNEIVVVGARSNNLKNITVRIPRNQLVVVTGVSGSGKSSLTIDTLFAEGQRRYVESLSSYARQFLMRMKKPDLDYIHGICPAIAIEQKVTTGNNRSTVGSMTELYDYFRLLFARIGRTYSPISGKEVKKHEVSDVLAFIKQHAEDTRVVLYIKLPKNDEQTLEQALNMLLQKGYNRAWVQDTLYNIEDMLSQAMAINKEDVFILLDRFVVQLHDDENDKRIADSIQTAFLESGGDCYVAPEGQGMHYFNNRFEADGIVFVQPSPQLFNYNNPFGACSTCEGYGKTLGIDDQKVIPNPNLSIFQGAIACWGTATTSDWYQQMLSVCDDFDIPIHTPYNQLSAIHQHLLWQGNSTFGGIYGYFKELEANLYKIQNRILLSRYRGKTTCPTCQGSRLCKEASYVRVKGYTLNDWVHIPISELATIIQNLVFDEYEHKIAGRILLEANNRLRFLLDVGLNYLTLERVSSTLSGGETQRINLTRTLGSNLTSALYILDEPSVGLHPRDTAQLVKVLKNLRDLGNTVVVVEHEEEVIANCDYLVDIGPRAGLFGGELVFSGAFSSIFETASDSLTAQYMNGTRVLPVPTRRRPIVNKITVQGARQHNLKNVSVQFPLNTLTVVTGVSGSGKTTLVKQILYPALRKHFDEPTDNVSPLFDGILGDLKHIHNVELVNQHPIGKSSRSNPVTYVKAWDGIRDLFSKQPAALIRGFQPKHFSFNVEGGRCETCKGDGETVVEMQFLADVHLTCEDCGGKRFKPDVLEVAYKEMNISQVLEMSIEEALHFFAEQKDIVTRLQPLYDVGLGYIKLGQSNSTLSGGEAQRVKLASFLVKENQYEKIFFIFDEPTTGLHFDDIRRLLDALNALVERGHTVLVVEHNVEVIKSADWVIDLGPEGGNEGGYVVFAGTPEDLARCEASHTGKFLRPKLAAAKHHDA